VTWAILTFADGAVINLGVSYALPARYPTLGQSDRLELLGSEGTMIIDDDHLDQPAVLAEGHSHAYVPDHSVDMAFLGSKHRGRLGRRRFSGARSATRRGPGSIISPPARRRSIQRRSRRASIWRRRSPSSAPRPRADRAPAAADGG